MKTLWQWLPSKDEWTWLCAVEEAGCKMTLRGYRRRNPRGTVFKWTDGAAPVRKYRKRMAKESA